MVDILALRTEFNTDPKTMGYASLISANNDEALVNLLNATTGNGSESHVMLNMPHGDFIKGIAPMLLILPSKDEATQKKWDRMLNVLNGLDPVGVGTPEMGAIFSVAIADGLLTQEQIDSFANRMFSRAEILFGENTIVYQTEVAQACRNEDGTGAL